MCIICALRDAYLFSFQRNAIQKLALPHEDNNKFLMTLQITANWINSFMKEWMERKDTNFLIISASYTVIGKYWWILWSIAWQFHSGSQVVSKTMKRISCLKGRMPMRMVSWISYVNGCLSYAEDKAKSKSWEPFKLFGNQAVYGRRSYFKRCSWNWRGWNVFTLD